MDRIEEIREMAEYEGWSDPDPLGRNTVPVADAAWLLERVGELERENEKLKHEAEGLHAMIQQAIHPPS